MPPTDLLKVAKDVDPQVAETIMKGLEVRPEDRWQTVSEMLEPLREAEQRRRTTPKK
jgi:hypothetical protein